MRYDLLIIGGGSAGTSAAIEGARMGARVGVINDGPIGGTCVNVGCVPSKYLLKVAGLLRPDDYPGVKFSAHVEDFPALMEGLSGLVKRYRKEKYTDVLTGHGVDVIEGRGRLISPKRVLVGDREVEGGAVVIATGSSPNVPEVEGIDSVPYLTNRNLFSLRELPSHLIVLGGGYVSVEMAQAFRRLGSKVTVVQRSKRLLSREDRDVSAEIESILRDEGVNVLTGRFPERVEGREGDIRVTFGDGTNIEGSHLLIATGRRGNTGDMGLEEVGIETYGNGFVKVNGRMETSVPGVYAAGDVTGPPMFVYVAAREGKVAALNALTGAGMTVNYGAVPFVIFTHPQVAGVGPTERELQMRGIMYEKVVLPASEVPAEGIHPESRGFIKVLRGTDGRLLSVRAVMRNAGEMIMTTTVALATGMTVKDITDLFFPYLAHTEGLRLTALAFDRDVEDMSCCAG